MKDPTDQITLIRLDLYKAWEASVKGEWEKVLRLLAATELGCIQCDVNIAKIIKELNKKGNKMVITKEQIQFIINLINNNYNPNSKITFEGGTVGQLQENLAIMLEEKRDTRD